MGIILGLLGAGAMVGGAMLGTMFRQWQESQKGSSRSGGALDSSPEASGPDYGSSYQSYYGGSSRGSSHSSSSYQSSPPVYRYDKETGRLEQV